ncbi:MAG: tetratricopeptide repeat protein [Pseudomonadota bacterium]
MGIFDRFRSAGPADHGKKTPDTSGQDAERLIDEGHLLEAEGRLDEAMQRYLSAIQLSPNPARAHLNHGNILLLKGDLPGALNAFSTALTHKPDYAGAYYNIGNALLGNRQFDEAVANYRRALEIQPDYAEVHCSLGVALKELGKLDDAVASFQMALKIKPDLAEAHFSLGLALHGLGQFEGAVASFRRTVELRPDFADAHSNLGFVLLDIGQHEEAVASYRRALEIKPDLAVAHNNLGAALEEQGKLNEAEASYRRALEIEPNNAIYRVAHMFISPTAPQTVADSIAVPGNFDQSLQNLSDWMLSAPEQREHISEALSLQPAFYLAYRDGNHVARLSHFGDMLITSSPHTKFKLVSKPAKLKLLVVSNHFRRHSVWDVILRGILVNLDRTRFEVILYNLGHLEDEETKLAQSLSDVWRDYRTISGLNGWLAAISEDQPDVIFYPEIGMNHMSLRLAANRLAPLQVASWGHPITTGLPTIDLYFSGDMLEPPDADTHYRERLVRLPGTGCCTMPIELAPEKLHQLEADLAMRRGTRFVIAQTPFKFDPADDALFASIAAAVGECTFILFNLPNFSWAMELLIARLNRAFCERNLDPEHHLLVIPWLPREKFYTLIDLCDIYLDCPSFSGYTTAWQAVHRGIPVVTLEGKFMRQRLAAGLLRKIGMTDTIAASKDAYVEIAARLAAECREPDHRDARRHALKAAAPLADNDVSVVRAFERSLIEALAEQGRHFEFDDAKQLISNSFHPNKG